MDAIEKLDKQSPVERDTSVTIHNSVGECVVLTDEEAKEVFRALRKLYGRKS